MHDLYVKHLRTMLHSPIRNYIVPGVTSWLVGGHGGPEGRVRLFESERRQWEMVTPHSHRFDFQSVVVQGAVTNTLWAESSVGDKNADAYCESEVTYDGGGPGKYSVKRLGTKYYVTQSTRYAQGERYLMYHSEIHSIQFEKNTMLLIYEGPRRTDKSIALEPVVAEVVINTFKVEPWMFSIIDK